MRRSPRLKLTGDARRWPDAMEIMLRNTDVWRDMTPAVTLCTRAGITDPAVHAFVHSLWRRLDDETAERTFANIFDALIDEADRQAGRPVIPVQRRD